MSSRIEAAPAFGEPRLWVVAAILITVGLAIHWAVAAGMLLVFLIHTARPFDVIVAFLLVVGGATFVKNSGGNLTFQLSLLVAVILLMLLCYVVRQGGRAFSIPQTPVTRALVVFMLWSMVNAARGLVWNVKRYLGLELLPLLALGSALLVANVFDPKRDLRPAIVGLIVIGFVCAAGGLPESATRFHTPNTYVMASPGLVGLLIINLALRSPRRETAVIWTAVSLPLFLHQLITFGRGLWTGGLAGLVFSFLVYAGVGRGSRPRWGRCGLVIATVVVLGLVGVAQAAVFLGRRDFLGDVGARLASSTETKVSYETRSNLIRLWEYATAIGQIRTSPWIGHGLGFTFPNKEPFSGKTYDQWYCHQSYLLIWLKQGLVGLVLFLWVLWSATSMSAREARRHEDPWISAWFATTGAATVFMAVFSMSNFPFAVVNETFLLAFLWGGSMAMARSGFTVLRWKPPAGEMLELGPRSPTARVN